MGVNISTAAAALFSILVAPFVGFFVEGNITVTSCLCSVVAFFLLIREVFFGESHAE